MFPVSDPGSRKSWCLLVSLFHLLKAKKKKKWAGRRHQNYSEFSGCPGGLGVRVSNDRSIAGLTSAWVCSASHHWVLQLQVSSWGGILLISNQDTKHRWVHVELKALVKLSGGYRSNIDLHTHTHTRSPSPYEALAWTLSPRPIGTTMSRLDQFSQCTVSFSVSPRKKRRMTGNNKKQSELTEERLPTAGEWKQPRLCSPLSWIHTKLHSQEGQRLYFDKWTMIELHYRIRLHFSCGAVVLLNYRNCNKNLNKCFL